MFQFGWKKDKDERDRKKREKREKKEKAVRDGGRLSTQDLQRLDEIRRSFRTDTGGIADGDSDGRQRRGLHDDDDDNRSSGSGSPPPPPLPSSRPPIPAVKKGILKGASSSSKGSYSFSHKELDDASLLLRNTKDNEYVNVYRRSAVNNVTAAAARQEVVGLEVADSAAPSSATSVAAAAATDREVSYDEVSLLTTTRVRVHPDHVSPDGDDDDEDDHVNGGRSRRATAAAAVLGIDPLGAISDPQSLLNGEGVGSNHGRELPDHGFQLRMPTIIGPTTNRGTGVVDDQDMGVAVLVLPADRVEFRKISGRRGRPLLLVEPSAHKLYTDEGCQVRPGDQVVEVDGVDVSRMDPDEALGMLRATAAAAAAAPDELHGRTVTLKVGGKAKSGAISSFLNFFLCLKMIQLYYMN